MAETTYAERTDGVADKVCWLLEAHENGDHDLAMSLAESVKDSLALKRQLQAPIEDDPVLGASSFGSAAQLPPAWAQQAGHWRYFKALWLDESAGLERSREPVEVSIAFGDDQVSDLRREVRVARLDPHRGQLNEVVSQVHGETRHGGTRCCRLSFLADVGAGERVLYLILYGNPYAELPRYTTDLAVTGEGCGLDIGTHHYRVRLAAHTGQLERLVFSARHRSVVPSPRNPMASGLELYAGGEGHGEAPHIDWAHDYVTADQFQKFRVTNWARCPTSR